MRERRVVLEGSFCDLNLYADGPQTLAEARKEGPQRCPKYTACNSGGLDPVNGYQCAMMFGLEVAQNTLKNGNTIEREMSDFRKAELHPRKGWMYSPDRKTFTLISDGEEAIKLVEHFAHVALNDSDPTQHADPRLEVGSDFESVIAHAMTKDGIDLSRVDALEGRFGYNGGRGCDVQSGPCSCGAFH